MSARNGVLRVLGYLALVAALSIAYAQMGWPWRIALLLTTIGVMCLVNAGEDGT